MVKKIHTMKKILFLFLFPFLGFSQTIISNKVDEFTKTKFIETNIKKGKRVNESDNIIQDKGSIYFQLIYSESKEKSIYTFNTLLLLKDELGCFVEGNSRLLFLLENDKTIECTQISTTDCKSAQAVNFILTTDLTNFSEQDKNFEELCMNKIKKIRLYGNKHYQDYQIKEEAKEYIQNHFLLLKSEINK